MIGILTLHLHLPACGSLKQKRSRIEPLIARLHREFNVSVSEMGFQDNWDESLICCAMVTNEAGVLQASLQAVARWVKGNWPDGMIVADRIELI